MRHDDALLEQQKSPDDGDNRKTVKRFVLDVLALQHMKIQGICRLLRLRGHSNNALAFG